MTDQAVCDPASSDDQDSELAGPTVRRGGILTLGMLALATIAWLGLLSSRMSVGMRKGLLTGGPILSALHGSGGSAVMPGMSMSGTGVMSLFGVHLSQDSTFSWAYFGGFMWMWAIMLAAMMFPVALPGVWRYREWHRSMTRFQFCGFLAGYYTVYLAAGAGAYAAMAALQSWSSAPSAGDVVVAALIVGVVGAYQLSTSKARNLDHCLGTPDCSRERDAERGGRIAGVRNGLAHGSSCLACCGPLMIVMLLVGMMNLAWMAILTALMVLERILPDRRTVARLIGGAFLAGTLLVILISPGGAPALL